MSEKGSAEASSTAPFPTKYLAKNTSGLTFKVEAKDNTADFKLDSKAE